MPLNQEWETYIKSFGADFVRFVDISTLAGDVAGNYTCAVLFGKALSWDYLNTLKTIHYPEIDEYGDTEKEMDALADHVADKLNAGGFKSTSEIDLARISHNIIACMSGIGFVGKNALLITEEYGCAVILGKVLTVAPFDAAPTQPMDSKCGSCQICVDGCPSRTLSGDPWSLKAYRKEIIHENRCVNCSRCLINCPFTIRYMEKIKPSHS